MAVQKTVKVEKNAVSLHVTQDETLVYRMTVRGAKPSFVLTDSKTKEELLSDEDTPESVTPETVFERQWPQDNDLTADSSEHVMGMDFGLGGVEYHYVVEHHDKQDKLLETLIDITYKSDTPGDTFFQDLGVMCS
jgi:hypothetical protein